VVQQILFQNWIATPTRVDLVMFLLALFALMLRVRRLRQVTASDERSDWRLAVNTARSLDRLRRVVGRSGIAAALAVAVLLPPLLNQSHALLMSQVLVFALIAVSLTILAGWSGQLSLGQLAFVAVGLVVYTRLSDSMSLLLLFLVAGAISAVVAVVIGIPALRIPGLYLAVSTLGLALLMNVAVLPANCFDVGFRFCPGLPDPAGTYTKRPHLFGLSLANEHTVTYVVLGVLCVVLLAAVAWRDRGLARLLLAVRGNELAAAAMGVRPIRTKLIAFAVSGFLAGVAGVCFGLVNQRTSVDSFQASLSYDVVAMVVVGGLGSLSGAVLGAVYLIGLPAIFGSTPTVQVLVSGVGLLGFLLFMPGGVSTALSSAADAITGLVRRAGLWRAPDAAAVPADELAEPVGAGR
jgi:ABC-type branched-subunit amino acid transport system permease subunit